MTVQYSFLYCTEPNKILINERTEKSQVVKKSNEQFGNPQMQSGPYIKRVIGFSPRNVGKDVTKFVNVSKCVCGQGYTLEPAGGAYSATQAAQLDLREGKEFKTEGREKG